MIPQGYVLFFDLICWGSQTITFHSWYLQTQTRHLGYGLVLSVNIPFFSSVKYKFSSRDRDFVVSNSFPEVRVGFLPVENRFSLTLFFQVSDRRVTMTLRTKLYHFGVRGDLTRSRFEKSEIVLTPHMTLRCAATPFLCLTLNLSGLELRTEKVVIRPIGASSPK